MLIFSDKNNFTVYFIWDKIFHLSPSLLALILSLNILVHLALVRCECNHNCVMHHCTQERYSLLNSFSDDGDNVRSDLYSHLIQTDLISRLTGLSVGHCDGIIYLRSHDCQVMLCNPVLQEFKLLPETQTFFDYSCNGAGFGYDSKTKDYKFIRIFWMPHVGAEISLATNSWRRIKELEEHYWTIEISTGHFDYFCWKGVCYWKSEISFIGQLTILCFDMSNEKNYIIVK